MSRLVGHGREMRPDTSFNRTPRSNPRRRKAPSIRTPGNIVRPMLLSDFLTPAAQIAVGIAGFTGVVRAFSNGPVPRRRFSSPNSNRRKPHAPQYRPNE